MHAIATAAAAALSLIAQVAAAATCAGWPAEVYLLRHAEKLDNSANSALSPAGWQRAGGLPQALAGVKVGAILVSDKQRTQQTALALATSTGVQHQAFQQQDGIADLVQAICTAGRNGVAAVAVIGHESTVPKVMEAIGVAAGDATPPGFGDLFLVRPGPAPVQVEHRRYGDCRGTLH